MIKPTKPTHLEQILSANLTKLMDGHPELNTVYALAKKSGVGRGTVQRVRHADVSTSLENLEKLAEAFDLEPAQLLSPRLQSTGVSLQDAIEILQYAGIGGSMGTGVILRDQPGEIRSWRVTPEWIRQNIKHHSGVSHLCIVTGFGDSMKPLYNPGDPLIIDTGIRTVDWDAVYFFRVGNEGFIKRLQRIPGEGIRVLSTNKEYESWTIKPDMDFEVFGQVLKAWSSTDF